MVLCPPRKTLEVNLMNYLTSLKYQKAVQDAEVGAREPTRTGRPGRPSRASAAILQSNQSNFHSLFPTTPSSGLEGMSENNPPRSLASLVCYGFRGPNVQYGRNWYVVTVLLDDPHRGVQWYPEPHLRALLDVRGITMEVSGAFRHKKCHCLSLSALSFPNLTCPMCVLVPLENDFRMHVRREE